MSERASRMQAVWHVIKAFSLAIAVAWAIAPTVPVRAQLHRARLSVDLEERLAFPTPEPIDVIVQGTAQQITQLAAFYQLRVKRLLRSGAVLEVPGTALAGLIADPSVDQLSGDVPVGPVRPRALAPPGPAEDPLIQEVTPRAIGADQVWAGVGGVPGMTGRRIGVAVIDSGIAAHPALDNRVLVSVDFTGGQGEDAYGHGTHVAGIIAGRAAAGIAPGAALINLRVLGPDGSGRTSDVLEAIDWAIDNKQAYNIRVINLSIGHSVLEPSRDDPLCKAVERAYGAGIVVVVSAGNLGKAPDGRPVIGGITSPGNAPDAITVGALNTHGTVERSDDTMTTYSSRGPTRYDLLIKPDLVAPGNKITSLEAPGSYLSQTYPQLRVMWDGKSGYLRLSGTSMAAAVVSGAAALLLDAKPDLTPAQVKFALQITSSFMPVPGLLGAGSGSLDVAKAVQLAWWGPDRAVPETRIAGWPDLSSGLVLLIDRLPSAPFVWGGTLTLAPDRTLLVGRTLVWRNATIAGSTVVWGDTLLWSNGLVWGNTVVWGDTIVWGDTVVWGDTIVWGDTLVWGDTVVWGDVVIRGDPF